MSRDTSAHVGQTKSQVDAKLMNASDDDGSEEADKNEDAFDSDENNAAVAKTPRTVSSAND